MGLIPVKAHTWVVGPISSWGAYRRQLIDVSLSQQCLSLSNQLRKKRDLLPIEVKLIITCIRSFNYPKLSALLASKLHCHIDQNYKEMSLKGDDSVIYYNNNVFYLTFVFLLK